ncbi:nuclear transport factor 2 family protein [Pleionea sp. CnH1-48]|uniref:nuclear transport factor 2 family protein n=1 Tax=Pleionea sp. CnH1-48 TaxID=2954494 RepID=UPI00209772B5|nr:nuclear transport factor 2 family protein [Pleionea sp. CnH1-48]MCO7225811.1 nuclear transport factor 2 family protein [Pleionea sp. CnH1-48]
MQKSTMSIAMAGLMGCLTVLPAKADEKAVRSFIDAFNKKQTKAMLAMATPDIRWMSVMHEHLSVETKGRSALGKAMDGYFKHYPKASSSLLDISSHGPFIHTVEKATWQQEGSAKSQCSHAIYEMEQKQIKSVWYFSSYAC